MGRRRSGGQAGHALRDPPGNLSAPRFTALDGLGSFLSRQGNTLLIKGDAGAGKTTLALQLLSELAPAGDGVYVSSRVSRQKLQDELPWTKFNDRNEPGTGGFVDLRLGSSATFLQEILGVISSKRSAPPAIVIDTWDGIAKEMSAPERLKAEKMLTTVADSTKSRTIFVSEEPERSTMDYLVDGIVEMKREEKFGRVFREIEVHKLRGTLIDQHRYLYTLLGGRFNVIPPYTDVPIERSRPPPTIKSAGEFLSFGSPDLDAVFGGLRRGSVFVLVYDESVPYTAIRLVTLPAVINALNAGHAVLDVPLPGTTNRELADAVRPFIPDGVYRDCLAIGSPGADADLLPPLYDINGAEPRQAAGRVNELIARVRGHSKTKSLLMVEALGSFEAMYASRTDLLVEAIGARVGTIRSGGADTLVFLMQHDSSVLSKTLAMSGRYARMFVRNRSVVILGEKPATPAYAVTRPPGNELAAKLVQIV